MNSREEVMGALWGDCGYPDDPRARAIISNQCVLAGILLDIRDELTAIRTALVGKEAPDA